MAEIDNMPDYNYEYLLECKQTAFSQRMQPGKIGSPGCGDSLAPIGGECYEVETFQHRT